MKNSVTINKVILPLGLLTITGNIYAQKQDYPNVIFILADDYGWNDLSCMGSDYYETPNIDRIAKQGVLFTNAYATCSVSSPSRASILTGKYTPRHGVTDWIGEASGEEWRKLNRHSKLLPADYVRNLPKEETTLPEYLHQYGYTTFIAGKWHLGDKGSWPEDHGFDINKGGWSAGYPGKGGYFSPYMNPKLPDGEPGENLSMRLANETVSFIHDQVEKKNGKPFFAYLSFYAVHGPLQTTESRWKYFREKAEKAGIKANGFIVDRALPVRQTQDNPVYAGLIQQMDDAVGVVLDALEEMGLDKNTMVIFTSDNGRVTTGDAFSTSLRPLRGGKGRQWEGGIREPLFIKYPGCQYPGSQCDVPVIGTDFYPTILDFAHIPLLPEQHKDGVSIMPLMEGKSIAPRALYWHYPHYGNQGGEPSSIIRKGNWKLIFYHEDQHCELYNLAIDITESKPMNSIYPEKVIELKKQLDEWLAEVGAKMPVPDPLYDPQEEEKVKEEWRTGTLKQVENLRRDMLKKDWKPNETWWGSQVTID
ncbi:MAG: sulfatase [Bacteroides sp.]|nr:sulfatase [Bacteroides sp.]